MVARIDRDGNDSMRGLHLGWERGRRRGKVDDDDGQKPTPRPLPVQRPPVDGLPSGIRDPRPLPVNPPIQQVGGDDVIGPPGIIKPKPEPLPVLQPPIEGSPSIDESPPQPMPVVKVRDEDSPCNYDIKRKMVPLPPPEPITLAVDA